MAKKKNVTEEVTEKEVKEETKKEELVEEKNVEKQDKDNNVEAKKEEIITPKKKSSAPLIITIIILVLIILGLGSFIVYDKFFSEDVTQEDTKKKDDSKKDEEKEENKEEKDEEKEDEKDLKYELVVYKSDYGYCMKSSYCNKVGYKIPVSTENATIYDVESFDSKYYVLYEDEDMYLYDIDGKKKTKLDNLDTDYVSYNMLGVWESGKVYGVECGKGTLVSEYSQHYTNTALYNIKNDEMMYENQGYFDFTFRNNSDYINASKAKGSGSSEDDFSGYLLNFDREDVVLSDTGFCVWFDVREYNDDVIYVKRDGCMGGSTDTLYNSKKQKFISEVSDTSWAYDGNGYIYANIDDKVNKYDTTGKLVKSSIISKNIKQVILNYVVKVNDDKELVIVNLENSKEYKLMNWKDSYFYHSMISGYYAEDALTNENEKDAGIYMIIGYGTYGDEGEEGVEYYFNPKTNEVKKYELDYIGGYAKPVLYLYPEEKTDVTINFENENSLTTTYPKFNDEWKVTAYPNGDLYDENGRYYYGLYWEEDKNHDVSFDTGFYVTKENAIEFLEEKLSYIGLTEREMNEFIMYWLPILEKNGQSLVYFELTEERDCYNKLLISPTPDSIFRLAIHVKKVDSYQNIKEEKLTRFNRTGFTVVEWGGINY